MRGATGIGAALAVAAACVSALPAPQYGGQGMAPQYGGQGMAPYGYPMMGGGGPMMGPYGMGDAYGGMCMPNGGGYRNGRMRGQRYHAHASADEWPLPNNPYMDARSHRRFSRQAFYADGGPGDAPMMHAPGHNRIPANDADSDDDNDDDDASSASSASSD
ncbi:hypothetical protein H4R20_005421, partial [Coemansia guatemalensis]